MLYIFIIILSLPSIIFGDPKLRSFRKLDLSKYSVGPESIAFDAKGRGPYTSISDGRIVRYEHSSKSFQEFSFTQPNRSKIECDGKNLGELGVICGRPLGLEFYLLKNKLFIADAYRGLLVVGPRGGLAKQIATSAEGVPFRFTNGLSVDQFTGDIYFTDFSSKFPQSQFMEALRSKDKTGRLLKYEKKTRKVKVLLRGLAGANGVAISSDSSFVLVAEGFGKTIIKVWLRGDRAFEHEVVMRSNGMPDNIKRAPYGDHFWVAFNFNEPGQPATLSSRGIKIDGDGKILEEFDVGPYYNTTMISEFNQHGDRFFAGSVEADYVGAF